MFFVSILVRTWITALCLYLPKIGNNNKFTLVVSPFIKESTALIGKIGQNTDDNLPISINKQIIIIKNFLKFLRENISSNSNQLQLLPQYIQSSKIITDFFDKNNGVLEIYGVKEMKDKKFKYVKYEIIYDSLKNCYVSTNKTENYFDTILKLINQKSEILEIKKLQILPGVRKPTTNLNISQEPLSRNEAKKFKNCISNIKIGIIDIDEEKKVFKEEEIKNFYNNNKKILQSLNILVVCTQNSSSQGRTTHFQHLLKEVLVLEEKTNTNFNFKNSNKKNTTEVFGSISGSKAGLRTRVYTQGLDNDRLEVVFNTVDFSYISSNEGAILCSINYDGEDLIKVLNFFSNVNEENIDKKKKIKNKILSKIPNVLSVSKNNNTKLNIYRLNNNNIFFCGNTSIIQEFRIEKNNNITYIKLNKDLNDITEPKEQKEKKTTSYFSPTDMNLNYTI
jgi:hypothetical protein